MEFSFVTDYLAPKKIRQRSFPFMFAFFWVNATPWATMDAIRLEVQACSRTNNFRIVQSLKTMSSGHFLSLWSFLSFFYNHLKTLKI